VSGLLMRQVWSLALMLRAERGSNKNLHFKWCVDPSGFSRSPERPYLHYVVMPSSIGVAVLSAGARHVASNSSVPCISRPDHDGPGHPRHLVGERLGRHFRGSALYQSVQPRPPLRSVLARVVGLRRPRAATGNIDYPLGDTAEPVLAASGVLLRSPSNRETPVQREPGDVFSKRSGAPEPSGDATKFVVRLARPSRKAGEPVLHPIDNRQRDVHVGDLTQPIQSAGDAGSGRGDGRSRRNRHA
jgi:hypothetical protein